MKKNILFAAPILTILFCLCLVAFCPIFDSAHAEESIPFSITAVTGYEPDENGVVVYQRSEIDPSLPTYRKDVEITFEVGSYDAKVFLVAEEELDVTDAAVRSGEKLTYRVTVGGIVTVCARTYSSGAQAGERSVTVRSDVTPPQKGTANKMQEWLPEGREFIVAVDLTTFTDDLSGRGDVYYKAGENYVRFSDVDAESLTFAVSSAKKIDFLYFDAAGNMASCTEEYSLFDVTPPPAPTITVTPNATDSAYAREYAVEITYYPDSQSGVREKTYFINGQKYDYNGAFILDVPNTYVLSAYSTDSVGNRSETVQTTIASESFDTMGPTVSRFVLEFDVRNEKVCRAYLSVRDSLSGLQSVFFRDLDVAFLPTSADSYYADLDCYGSGELVLVCRDRAGNETVEHYPLNLFGIPACSEKIERYAEKYAGTDFSRYTTDAKATIDGAYSELNVLIGSNVSTERELDAALKRVDDAFSPSKVSYSIEETTDYLTGMLEYEVFDADFSDLLVGEEVKLVFSKAPADDSFVQKAGFPNGFTDGFSLRLYVGEEERTSLLDHGVAIRLNLPVGYYERSFALYANGQQVEADIVNNKLEFTLKSGSDFVLAISGSRSTAKNAEQKYIEVFGRKLSYGTFFGTIFGVIGGAAVLVAVLIVLVKVRGRQHLEY